MGLMRNKNLEAEYLNALEDLGLELDFETDNDKDETQEEDKDKK